MIIRILAIVLALGAAPVVAEPLAKELFGAKREASQQRPAPIGSYAKGCAAGLVQLPESGPTWQAMRLSRNRNWGHPETIDYLVDLSETARDLGWAGLYVGDISQPRGGPMLTGHASHQLGLDADIWLTPMPDRKLTRREREEMSATNVVRRDRLEPGRRRREPAGP